MMMAQGGVSLPAGYTKIEYLESDGNSYIDTGFKPNQDSRIKLDIQVTKSATSFLFGARANSSANSASNSFSMPQISGSSLRMDYGSKETSITISPLQRLDIDVNKNVVTINGIVTTVPSQTFQGQYSLYLLSVNTAGALFSTQTAARIYSCQIYDNGTLVRDFIPAMNDSEVAGLYDLVNNVFYPLQEIVTKKENKITCKSEFSSYFETPTGYLVAMYENTANAVYPVDSNIKVEATASEFGTGELWGDYEATISKGEMIGRFLPLGHLHWRITSISPTEDDTYIYTF